VIAMRLNYYEKVRVTKCQRFPEYNGKTGVVLGISDEDGKTFTYALAFPGDVEGCIFLPEELERTGEFADPRDFYNENDRIRVRVIDGEAFIVE